MLVTVRFRIFCLPVLYLRINNELYFRRQCLAKIPPNSLFSGYRWLISRGWSGWKVTVSTDLRLVPMLRMGGVTPPHPLIFSCLAHGLLYGTFTFYNTVMLAVVCCVILRGQYWRRKLALNMWLWKSFCGTTQTTGQYDALAALLNKLHTDKICMLQYRRKKSR